MNAERPLDARGFGYEPETTGKHDFVAKPQKPKLTFVCRPCGVIYLNAEGNCLLCSRFTQPLEIGL